jgi:hypothetical protein
MMGKNISFFRRETRNNDRNQLCYDEFDSLACVKKEPPSIRVLKRALGEKHGLKHTDTLPLVASMQPIAILPDSTLSSI